MAMFDEKTIEKLREVFSQLTRPVRIIAFTQEHECPYCNAVRGLLDELPALSDRISVEAFDFNQDAEQVKAHGVDKVPALIIQGDRDVGVRYYGVPAGHEFATLIGALVDFGTDRPSPLSSETLEGLAKLDRPIHMQVFVTPTCPHCPQSVRLAHLFAQASEHITADGIEAGEFPALVQKYGVQGVPKTVINETTEFVGAHPEAEVLRHVLAAAAQT